MKNLKLVALACATAGGAGAHAQSSVTLYGAVDAYVEVADGGAGNVTRVGSGGATGSRFGFRGTEDLGGGLRAVFTLETDFFVDTGAPANAAVAFQRQAFVGLASNTYGTLTAGRQYTPHFLAMAAADPAGWYLSGALNYYATPAFTPPGGGVNGVGADSTTRRPNSVHYLSPSFAGFQFKGYLSAGEGTDARVRNVAALYNSNTLFGTVSYLQEKATYVAGNTDKYLVGTLGYDFGFIKPSVIYVQRRGDIAPAPDIDAWQIGASAPLLGGSLILTYAELENKTNDAFSSKAVGLRYDYPLSKRTKLYGGASQITNESGARFTISGGGSSSPGIALSGAGEDPQSVYLGISHTF